MASSPEVYGRVGDYVIRKATLDDIQAISDIDKEIVHGLDYIPAMFYKFIQAEGDLPIVAEENGKPVRQLNR